MAEIYRRASYDMIWLGPPSAALLDDLIQIMGNDSSLARFSQTIKDFLVERDWGSRMDYTRGCLSPRGKLHKLSRGLC